MTYKHTNTCTHREQAFGNDRRCERTALVTCTHMLRPDTNNSKSRRASSLIICIANIQSFLLKFHSVDVPACREYCRDCIGTLWLAHPGACVCETEGERQRERAGGGVANRLFCGSVTWASTRGRQTGAQRLEKASYQFSCRHRVKQ